MRKLFGLAVVAAVVFVTGCSAQEATDVSPPAEVETQAESSAEPCDPSIAHPKGAFEFAPKLDGSLPAEWREEFPLILATLQEIAPISPCIHELTEDPAKSPMKIYAWSSDVDNPWEDERPGMSGASISGDGTDTWMVLEITAEEFEFDELHRYSVVAHEYWHVYQRAAWTAQGIEYPDWMWEGGAKVFEELYISEHYGRSQFDHDLFPVISTALANPSDFELYAGDGGEVGGDFDINYNTSAFMVLALAKELQTTRGLTEEQAFALALNPPAKPDSETAFLDVFGISLDAFYTSLAQYPAVESGEDWFEGTVVKASVVMPSKDLTLTAILQPTG